MADDWTTRYQRQILLPQIGEEGQRRLGESSVLVVGCGGLGGIVSSLLVRAGIGYIRIAERDTVELSNLHRQLLYGETDARDGVPKAKAAQRALRRANSGVTIETIQVDVNDESMSGLLGDMDIVIDGTDNLATRCVMNRTCVEAGVPWIYGGVTDTRGMVMTIVPGKGPCLRCLFPELVDSEESANEPILGILNTIPAVIGALQVTEAFKLLLGADTTIGRLLEVDVWTGEFQHVTIPRDPHCPICGDRYRE
jgi:adenylyltransferase/sulfurtransferase